MIPGSHESELCGWTLAFFVITLTKRLQSSLFALPWGVLPSVEKGHHHPRQDDKGKSTWAQTGSGSWSWLGGQPALCLSLAQPLSGWSWSRPSLVPAFLFTSGQPGWVTALSGLRAEPPHSPTFPDMGASRYSFSRWWPARVHVGPPGYDRHLSVGISPVTSSSHITTGGPGCRFSSGLFKQLQTNGTQEISESTFIHLTNIC